MVGRLHERMDLPHFVQRQAQAEGWHLRPLAALDHGFQEALVAELRGEEVRPPRAGAMVADVALAGVGDPVGSDGVRLARNGSISSSPARPRLIVKSAIAAVNDRNCALHP